MSKFYGEFIDFLPVNLLVGSHQAEIILKRLMQWQNNAIRVGVEPR